MSERKRGRPKNVIYAVPWSSDDLTPAMIDVAGRRTGPLLLCFRQMEFNLDRLVRSAYLQGCQRDGRDTR